MTAFAGMTAAFFLAGCALPQQKEPILATVPSGGLTWASGIPVLHLAGDNYEIGYQHGSLLREEVRASVNNAMAFIYKESGRIPILGRVIGSWFVHRRLDAAWAKMRPFVPPGYLEELKGLSDGAGVPLRTLGWIHALPELKSTSCASFAAYGHATKEGRMIHARNLDWAIQSDVQRYAAIFVVHPQGQRSFVNIGWLGFTGVISGINDAGISVGEIGAQTRDATLEGIPMPFVLRRVLEESDDLKEAVEIVKNARRSGGYNYLFADAKNLQAVALETTHSRFAAFWPDAEPFGPYHEPVSNSIFRADFAVDPAVRDLQFACKGDPSRPGLESPIGATSFDVRHRGQGMLLKKFHGAIDPEAAMTIAKTIAPSTNIQSVIYAYPQIWIANADGRRPAAMGRYVQLDLRDLFRKE
jgi:hypothetical protein